MPDIGETPETRVITPTDASLSPAMPRTLLSFHKRPSLPSTPYAPLTDPTKRALRNLLAHRRGPTRPAPRARSAAVLVALFIGRFGDLHVLLSSRAESMSSYAGDTALPGGRVDPTDASLEDTARREAFEEIGLPQDKTRIPFLCTLEPFLARNRLVVTPVVVLITDQTLRPILNDAEVKALFSHPLQAFLSESPPKPTSSRSNANEADPERTIDALTQLSFEDLQVQGTLGRTTPSTVEPEQTVKPGTVLPAQEGEDVMVESPPYHTYLDIAGMGGSPMRMHSFRTGREGQGVKPVYGLTR